MVFCLEKFGTLLKNFEKSETSKAIAAEPSLEKPKPKLAEENTGDVALENFSVLSPNFSEYSHVIFTTTSDPHMPSMKPENLAALQKLRELPRGSNVQARIDGVKNLLGENETFATLRLLRWPVGVVCPRCHGIKVIKTPNRTQEDNRQSYLCQDCSEQDTGGEGRGEFDDFTGLPICSLKELKQWILCWYLVGFCSVSQIASILGISTSEVIAMVQAGNALTQLPIAPTEALARDYYYQDKSKQAEFRQHLHHVEDTQEEAARSESKAPLKPGYKSKK